MVFFIYELLWSGNELGVEGAKQIANALESNHTLTTLDLDSTDSLCIDDDTKERKGWRRSYFVNYYGQTTNWEWKVPKSSPKRWRAITR
jgi:hypothetical protein